jgi:hypothetical protein
MEDSAGWAFAAPTRRAGAGVVGGASARRRDGQVAPTTHRQGCRKSTMAGGFVSFTAKKTHFRPVAIGCGGSITHKVPVSIGLWRASCHVAGRVAGRTSKKPNVYAACGAVAGPDGEKSRKQEKFSIRAAWKSESRIPKEVRRPKTGRFLKQDVREFCVLRWEISAEGQRR